MGEAWREGRRVEGEGYVREGRGERRVKDCAIADTFGFVCSMECSALH